jgi:hypothetical protein
LASSLLLGFPIYACLNMPESYYFIPFTDGGGLLCSFLGISYYPLAS